MPVAATLLPLVVVSPDPTSIQVLRLICRARGWPSVGFDLTPGDDPGAVAAFLAENDPAVVIFDVPYPYDRSWALFRQMWAAAGGHCPIVLTTTAPAGMQEWARGVDIAAIIEAPFGFAEIVAAAARFVERERETDAVAVAGVPVSLVAAV
jgi:DNA-binding response OmpR family regulator